MSPSLAPVSIRAAMTSAYKVIAACTPWIEVLRSAVIWEIETFITLVSSVMTNWPEARMMMGIHLRMGRDDPLTPSLVDTPWCSNGHDSTRGGTLDATC